MKPLSLLIILLSSSALFEVNAQEIVYEGKSYHVKGESIWIGNYDVTESLTLDAQKEIKEAHEAQAESYRKTQKMRRKQAREEEKLLREEKKAVKKAEKQSPDQKDKKKTKKFLIF